MSLNRVYYRIRTEALDVAREATYRGVSYNVRRAILTSVADIGSLLTRMSQVVLQTKNAVKDARRGTPE